MGGAVSKIITLTTDFGLSDSFVGVMKGVMLKINPALRLVDITHQVEPYNIFETALVLRSYYAYYPVGTVHLVVVDPGVGSERRPILAWTQDHYFIAPDNGVLSLVYQDPRFQGVREITARQYFLMEISSTFHGRDIFSPVSAWLASGVEPSSLGPQIEDYVRLTIPQATWTTEEEIHGEIIYVDQFGNLTSNIPLSMIEQNIASFQKKEDIRIGIGTATIQGINRFYGEGRSGEPSAIINSWGFLEIYVNLGNAMETLGMGKGQPLNVQFL